MSVHSAGYSLDHVFPIDIYVYKKHKNAQTGKNQKLSQRHTLNCTPFVRQYGILLGNGVFFYAKGSTEQTIHSGIQKTGD